MEDQAPPPSLRPAGRRRPQPPAQAPATAPAPPPLQRPRCIPKRRRPCSACAVSPSAAAARPVLADGAGEGDRDGQGSAAAARRQPLLRSRRRSLAGALPELGGRGLPSFNFFSHLEYNGGLIEESMRKYCEDKKRVMFEPEVGMEFSSTEEAFQYYNMYSWVIGFSIRLGDNYTTKSKQRQCRNTFASDR
ncbi:hypothetical protein QYE76_049037 [Lolium multiflorum]|uniref:Protein FAR1-RELATED SEQUENCE n=1 Tax=Lolium multiflorum TaxID=4521 RepID=A0AAD8WHZ2_LOLMU|nr:hypothetical protein QYE76_049037 [Lolium multiflorum]